jgi:hypothetical protein
VEEEDSKQELVHLRHQQIKAVRLLPRIQFDQGINRESILLVHPRNSMKSLILRVLTLGSTRRR